MFASNRDAEQRRTVLVVDDDEDVRSSLCELLDDHGYRALAASDGSDAFDVLGRESRLPDAVVLDLMMPVMNGYEVMEVLKSDHKLAEIPVIVVTANTHVSVPAADELLQKPFSPEALLTALEAQLS